MRCYHTIWSRCICYKHHFSGDKLMHRPNFLDIVVSKDFSPLTEIEQVSIISIDSKMRFPNFKIALQSALCIDIFSHARLHLYF